jgi:hypothetical protein
MTLRQTFFSAFSKRRGPKSCEREPSYASGVGSVGVALRLLHYK